MSNNKFKVLLTIEIILSGILAFLIYLILNPKLEYNEYEQASIVVDRIPINDNVYKYNNGDSTAVEDDIKLVADYAASLGYSGNIAKNMSNYIYNYPALEGWSVFYVLNDKGIMHYFVIHDDNTVEEININ